MRRNYEFPQRDVAFGVAYISEDATQLYSSAGGFLKVPEGHRE